MALLYGTLGEFDQSVEDWRSYMERVEEYFDVNDVPEEKKVKALLSSVGARTYKLLRSLTVPELPRTKSLAEINKLLQEHYEPTPLIICERFRFHKRDQKPNETVAIYIAELRRLSEHCSFAQFLNEALRDRFVCGLHSETIQKRLLSEKDLSLERAIDIAKAMDTASRDTEELQAKAFDSVKKIDDNVQKGPYRDRVGDKIMCYRCGSKDGHRANACRFINTKCNNCGKIGHLKIVCRSATANNVTKTGKSNSSFKTHAITDSLPDDNESDMIASVHTDQVCTIKSMKEINIIVNINEVEITMEVDSGSPIAIMPQWLFENYFKTNIPLVQSSRKLTTFNKSALTLVGVAYVKVKYKGKSENKLPLYVTTQGNTALCGREWLNMLCPGWCNINAINTSLPTFAEHKQLNSLLGEFPQIFEKFLGKIPNIKAEIYLKANTKPVYCKARIVPYSLRSAVELELQKLEKEGIITSVAHSLWATPIVPVVKSDGSVRICGDFKTTINPNLLVEQYPLPKIEDLFSNLSGGKHFSKVDLRQAYHQMELNEASKELMVINTHRGLYRYNRLVFGISSAPAIWQRAMEQILQGIPGIQVLQDDILITGKTNGEHFENLRAVLGRLQENGLKVNKEKCRFFEKSVEFCGHEVDANGLHKTNEKKKAVQNFPVPKNVSEVRSFLGLVNYYGKFIRNASTILHPLHELLEKQKKFFWTRACEEAFNIVKDVISSEQVLVHYNPKLPLRLACDASPVGIGCVLSHVMEDGEERPVAFASRTLAKAEKNYAQIDREALAIIWAIKKFYTYLYGQHFTLVTDHEPLTSIFHPHKAISMTSTARLQRYALFLSGFNYDIKYTRSRNNGNADGLSRAPLEESPERHDIYTNEALDIFHVQLLNTLPISVKDIKQGMNKDPTCSSVYNLILQGWPKSSPSKAITPYFIKRNELSIQQGVMMCGIRVVIPPSLQKQILEELHSGHMGIVKMKSLARSYVWWPGMDGDIQDITKRCRGCQNTQNMPETAPLHQWEYPSGPWRRVHADFAGPFLDTMFLIVQDSFSKWPEIEVMSSITTEKTIEALRTIFARNGLPEMLVTDNGAQFVSAQFQDFAKNNGIKHRTSAPYHPATNGLAERFVETFKRSIRSMRWETELTLKEKISKLLMAYRNTPHTITHEKPSMLLFNRHIKTRLDLLKPDLQQLNGKIMEEDTRLRFFKEGQAVLARDYLGKNKWMPGKIQSRTGPLSYVVRLEDGRIWRRHIDQLLISKSSEITTPVAPNVADMASSPQNDSVQDSSEDHLEIAQTVGPETESKTIPQDMMAEEKQLTQNVQMPRYPVRERKKPQRLICEDT